MAMKKGPWSPEEDRKLIAYITRYRIWNWSHMSKPAGLQRSGKSCRLRWVNYLRPGLKHGNFTREEVETILDLHQKLGNRWSVIASRLPGRTDDEIKNCWNTHLSRRLKHNLMPKSESFQIPFVETKPKSSSEIVLPSETAPKASYAETSGAIQLPLPSSNLAGEIDKSQEFGELQSILEQSFTAQGSYNAENSEAINAERAVSVTSSQLARFVQYQGNSCNDVWNKFLMKENIYGG
ncbi:hypothetical protein HRI_000947400 [Hibiscus trionum]|uniref:Uncharacterized protein n=1 Tax=Hibiscus trionum TaxID=183268 RepID=A0A9W7H8E3_HIBTR|nr:hypothetical protein HRI_000947400 [Hibiscus trionum]